MKRDSNSPSTHTDPNVYDLLDLTDNFTQDGRINLPNITALTPRGTDNPYDLWDHIISNYADLQPSIFDGNLPDGRVNWKDLGHMSVYWGRNDCNEFNNWCECADLDRDGKVNFKDYNSSAEQWKCDPNTISKATDRILPRNKKLSNRRHKAAA